MQTRPESSDALHVDPDEESYLFSEDFLTRLEPVVADLESESSAEIVVVVSPFSGSYRDVDHLLGFFGSTLFLFFALHSSVEFHVDTILLWMVGVYALVTFLGQKLPFFRRWLTSPERRKAQALSFAQSSFIKNGVSATRDRTGILLYLSAFEREIVILPDTGVVASIPPAEFHRLEQNCCSQKSLSSFEQTVMAELPRLKSVLSEKLPRKADDENELSDAVVVSRGVLS